MQRRDPADPPGAHLQPTLLNPHCHSRPPWPSLWPLDPLNLGSLGALQGPRTVTNLDFKSSMSLDTVHCSGPLRGVEGFSHLSSISFNPIHSLCPSLLYHNRCHNLNNNDDDDNLIGAMSSATLVRPLLPRCRCVKCRLADYTLTCCTSIVIVIINVIDMNRRVLRLLVHPVQVSVAFGIACMGGTSAAYIVLSVCQLHK